MFTVAQSDAPSGVGGLTVDVEEVDVFLERAKSKIKIIVLDENEIARTTMKLQTQTLKLTLKSFRSR